MKNKILISLFLFLTVSCAPKNQDAPPIAAAPPPSKPVRVPQTQLFGYVTKRAITQPDFLNKMKLELHVPANGSPEHMRDIQTSENMISEAETGACTRVIRDALAPETYFGAPLGPLFFDGKKMAEKLISLELEPSVFEPNCQDTPKLIDFESLSASTEPIDQEFIEFLYFLAYKDTGKVGFDLKTFFQRRRPYVYGPLNGLPILNPCNNEIGDEDLKDASSFPSGHSFYSKTFEEILVRAFPQMAKEIRTSGKRVRRDRVLSGFHYVSDIEAGEELAKEIISEPSVKHALEKIRKLAPHFRKYIRKCNKLRDEALAEI